MSIKQFSFLICILFLLACHSGGSGNKNGFDSCSVAVPFDKAKLAESLVAPDYSGELNNYWGDDQSKLDFKHIFKDGKVIKSIFYYENGNIQEEYEFKCGSLHGIQKEYYENGIAAKKISYRYGRMEGTGELFSEEGTLISKVIFKADSLISQKRFNKDGSEIRD